MVHSYWITENVYGIYSQSYRVKSHHYLIPSLNTVHLNITSLVGARRLY